MPFAEGIYRVETPMPFPPGHINCYIVQSAKGFILVDTGLNYPPAHQAWQKAFDSLGIRPSQVESILLTHFHPDHYGGASWLQQLTGSPVFIHRLDALLCEAFWRKEKDKVSSFAEHFILNGMHSEEVRLTLDNISRIFSLVEPAPEITFLPAEDADGVFAGKLKTIWTPGHSDGHVCYFEAKSGTLLSGDHLLADITPNISFWPMSRPNPLKDYLRSLDALQSLAINSILPGHGCPFEDAAGRIQRIKEHNGERLGLVAEAAGSGHTPYDISRSIFGKNLSLDQKRMALGETLSHLHYLEREGFVTAGYLDGVNIYAKTAKNISGRKDEQ